MFWISGLSKHKKAPKLETLRGQRIIEPGRLKRGGGLIPASIADAYYYDRGVF